MNKAMNYKKIHIQHMVPLQQPQVATLTRSQLLNNVSFGNDWGQNSSCLSYMDTAISQQRVSKPYQLFKASFFFDAFWYAYTKHGDIVLVPDEIWIMISFYLSTYIDKNAEKLRKKLVRHDGIKNLVIAEIVMSKQQSEEGQKNWDYFFDQVIKAIQQQSAKGIVQIFACDFSTTNKVYKTISTAIIMNSLKNYFQYQRFLAGCGINNAYMAGTRQDWIKIMTKLQKLVQFDVDGNLKKYIQHMNVIITNFIATFDGKPDVAWWNTVMMDAKKREVYGGDQTEVDGWILHFFGLYQKTELTGFPEFTIKVPIKLTNVWTKTQKELVLVSDWSSVSKLNQRAYKPDVGLAIFKLSEGPIKVEEVKKNEIIVQAVTYGQKVKLNNEYLKANKIVVFLPEIQPKTEKKRQKVRNPTLQKLARKQPKLNL